MVKASATLAACGAYSTYVRNAPVNRRWHRLHVQLQSERTMPSERAFNAAFAENIFFPLFRLPAAENVEDPKTSAVATPPS